MCAYHLRHCSSVDIMLFLVSGSISRLPPCTCCCYLLTESIYFISVCKQILISALHPCVQFILMMKYISDVCHLCTPFISCKQLWVIGPLICQKYLKHTAVDAIASLVKVNPYARQLSLYCLELTIFSFFLGLHLGQNLVQGPARH